MAEGASANAGLRGAEKVWAQLGIAPGDPGALEKVRNDPQSFDTLAGLATHDTDRFCVMFAINCLAIALPDRAETRSVLLDLLRHARSFWDYQTTLRALFATCAGDENVVGEIVAILVASAPGKMADLLETCLNAESLCIYHPKILEGIPEYVWDRWVFPVTRAPLCVLTRPGLRARLLDAIKSDPDGPVECVMERVLRQRVAQPWTAPRRKIWRTEETWDKVTLQRQFREERRAQLSRYATEDADPKRRDYFRDVLAKNEKYWSVIRLPNTPPRREQRHIMSYEEPSPEQVGVWNGLAPIVHDLFDEMTRLHPVWPRAADYVVELDTVAQRRQPGWRRDRGLVDSDLELRQARVAERLASWPHRAEVHRIFEDMLLERRAVRIEWPEAGWHFDPLSWREVAWRTLVAPEALAENAIALARLLVERGPWDDEARKSKEAIVAIAKAWPDDERVVSFLAEIASNPIVGDFVRDDIEKIRATARANIKLCR